MKHFLTVNENTRTHQFFIMDNTIGPDGRAIGQVGPYYGSMREATLAMFALSKTKYTNTYDCSQKYYDEMMRA